ncbi:MAG: autotransporter assembly complex family protein [Aquisalimonadaceae bacterium]
MTSGWFRNPPPICLWRLGVLWLAMMCSLPAVAEVRVNIQGIDGAMRDNVRLFVGLPPSDDPLVVSRFAGRARDQAREALQAVGYYSADIQVSTDRQGEDWIIGIRVDPGEPVIVTSLDITIEGDAAEDQAFIRLRERLPLREGARLHHGHYETAKRAMEALALSRGYFNASYDVSRIAVRREQREAEVSLRFNSGRRYRMGEVVFPELPLSDNLLQRLVPYDDGDPYSADEMAVLNRNLLNSGYFRDVRVRPRQDAAGEDLRVPVNAEVTMEAPNRIGTGIGYATDVGPRLRLNWRRPWVNADGHFLSAETEISEVRQSVSGNYTMPLDPPLEHKLQFFGGYQRENLEDTRSDKLTAGIQRQRTLRRGWQQNLFLRWEREEFVQAGERGRSTLTLPGTSVSRTRSRGGLDPDWGDRQFASVEFTHPELGSDISLGRFRMTSRWLRSIGRHRALVRAEYGALATEDLDRTPPSLRFFAGGDQSVRGFSYQSLAPRDDRNRLIGGRYLLAGTLEYSYRFAERWRAATFIDAGNAFSDSNLDEGFERGAGVGVRWLSPVGPIRLDVAWGVSDPELPWRIHLSMGPQL